MTAYEIMRKTTAQYESQGVSGKSIFHMAQQFDLGEGARVGEGEGKKGRRRPLSKKLAVAFFFLSSTDFIAGELKPVVCVCLWCDIEVNSSVSKGGTVGEGRGCALCT